MRFRRPWCATSSSGPTATMWWPGDGSELRVSRRRRQASRKAKRLVQMAPQRCRVLKVMRMGSQTVPNGFRTDHASGKDWGRERKGEGETAFEPTCGVTFLKVHGCGRRRSVRDAVNCRSTRRRRDHAALIEAAKKEGKVSGTPRSTCRSPRRSPRRSRRDIQASRCASSVRAPNAFSSASARNIGAKSTPATS